MPFFEIKTTPEITALIEEARLGKISVPDFCKRLTKYGVDAIEDFLYVHHAFGVPLEEAKKLCIEIEYGSSEKWAQDMCDVVDEISLDLEKNQD